jgi:hypothetical protein
MSARAGQVGGGWRTDAAPVGQVVEVWYVNTVILAMFDGQGWRTVDGARLLLVSHWRKRCGRRNDG